MSAAAIALLAEVIAGQERILERLDQIEQTIVDQRVRVETMADLLLRDDPEDGLTVVRLPVGLPNA